MGSYACNGHFEPSGTPREATQTTSAGPGGTRPVSLPRRQMTQNTDDAWEAWGVQDPFYSVLTDPKFRAAALTAETREEFFASGHVHVNQVLDICRQRLDPGFIPQRILDFGCGIGRLVIPFAAIAPDVVGMDVAPSMLTQARSNCDERGAANVTLVLSDDNLSAVDGKFDLVHTCIVLQHVEVARGRKLLAELVRRIQPGGCGAVHITFAWDAHEETFGQPPAPVPPAPPDNSLSAVIKRSLKRLVRALHPNPTPPPPPPPPSPDPEMQMNFYNLSELFFILHQAGVQRVHTEITDHGGALGSFLYFQMPSA